MFQNSTLVKSYSFLPRWVEIAQAVDDRLCGMGTLSFFVTVCVGGGVAAAAGLAALVGV